jgi:hypothetical protein
MFAVKPRLEPEPEPERRRAGALVHPSTVFLAPSRHGIASDPASAFASPETAVAGLARASVEACIPSFESVERWRPALAVSLHCTAHPHASNDDRFDPRVKPFAEGIWALTRRRNGTSGACRTGDI